ncbi:MAG: enoyl-CoA hydratase/isomerase family protein [Streptosporangiales bacterium]|nr:enoyl-CoA hydratase/isomerase family protein [Streptosporangiales bacterium]
MTEHISYEVDADRVVTLTIDQPGASANVMNPAYADAMGAALDRLEAERDEIAGVVVTSAKKTFVAGADLDVLVRVTPGRADEFLAELTRVKDQMRRLERLGRPVVAALNGSALGGGFEIALACHHRVCLDDDGIRLGLPEVTLGVAPGGGGITRMVRLLGLEAAFPYLTEGRQLRPSEAKAAGLVDALVPDREALLAEAKAWALANPDARQPWDTDGYRLPGGSPASPSKQNLVAAAPALMHSKTHGVFPAPKAILAAAVEGALVDVDTALTIESRYLVELVTGQVAKNMITAFWFQLNAIKSGRSRPDGFDRRATSRLGVLGAGMMGAGIAQVSALAGIDVVLKDVDLATAERGKATVAALLDERVGKGKLTAERRDATLTRITPTGDAAALDGCDLVIEAVFENRDLKRQVTAEAESHVAGDAVIASNTSTLPITGLAEAVPDPKRFVGLHFFSPVHRMPLVEIIRGGETSDETLARAFDYVLQIKKTPIVVNDSRGFFTSRVFAAYALEGIAMLAEGVPAPLIENVARRAGQPVGPLAVTDEVTHTLVWHIREQTIADLRAAGSAPEGNHLVDHPAFAVVDTFVNELGRTGKGAGAGFYDYPEGGTKRLWPQLATRYGRTDAGVPEDDVRDRLLFAQSIDTVRCLEAGVLTSVADANIGSIFGLGFPAWTGGALQFVNAYGLKEFVERADYLAERYGPRFTPPALLRERAMRNDPF